MLSVVVFQAPLNFNFLFCLSERHEKQHVFIVKYDINFLLSLFRMAVSFCT